MQRKLQNRLHCSSVCKQKTTSMAFIYLFIRLQREGSNVLSLVDLSDSDIEAT